MRIKKEVYFPQKFNKSVNLTYIDKYNRIIRIRQYDLTI